MAERVSVVTDHPLWPWQARAISEWSQLTATGERRICIASPTGGGKTRIIGELIRSAVEQSKSVVLYTTRKLLTEQMMGRLDGYGIRYGVRSASHADRIDLGCRVQISSVPTEASRVYKRKAWSLHDADVAIFDEAHMLKADAAERIMQDHLATGAVVTGFTATPLGIAHLYDRLIVAGNNSELREHGSHVKCLVFAPDEPDCSKVKRTKTGEFNIADIRKYVWTQAIFGRVLTHYRLLNPQQKPAICFGPDVDGSVWLAQQFTAAGIRAAHIDGEDVWLDGERFKSGPEQRAAIVEATRTGEIRVVCNRFVMREGIDIPELYHLILATPIGSLQSYIQTVGRVLRSHPSMDHCIVQDHGGNYWRHGSPNMDRDWLDCWKLDERVITELRHEKLREKKAPEPITCPHCGAVRLRGSACHHCGKVSDKKSRMILQHDGRLKEVTGDIFRPHRTSLKSDTEKKWEQMYYRMKRAGKTFRQAEGLFFHENHYYPPKSLRLMPANEIDWFKKINEVPSVRLQ